MIEISVIKNAFGEDRSAVGIKIRIFIKQFRVLKSDISSLDIYNQISAAVRI